MLATKELREGDGAYSTPDSRRNARLFGESGPGRSSLAKLEIHAVMSFIGPTYDPAKDSCLEAFVRVLLARIEAEAAIAALRLAAPDA